MRRQYKICWKNITMIRVTRLFKQLGIQFNYTRTNAEGTFHYTHFDVFPIPREG